MTHSKPADYDHLMRHARARFPGASITIIHTEDERIHIDADELACLDLKEPATICGPQPYDF